MFPSAASQSQKKLFGRRVSAELGGAASRGLALPGHEWAHRHRGRAGRSCGMEQPCRRMLLMCSWGRAALGRGAASSRAGHIWSTQPAVPGRAHHGIELRRTGTCWEQPARGRLSLPSPVLTFMGLCVGRRLRGRGGFGEQGQQRGTPSPAHRAWGREAALHTDTKCCNYIVPAQKHELWERLRLGNQCRDHHRCHSLLLMLPAL